ncbi:hypothetical protein QKU48_gp1255 [Fadolivirus algeromassiliense]|jgi:hypothetical protein|uniref:Uncharacterized protein n=1 Tax=Fadolivirus FV1/VV64 TaxID=3070911 RepID=A0A7D3URJ2_9VIRU|nr:hypothetical protein QKU48_gp1255 [Fadolivirus algeromassiliense]QKF94713.1 hypothetical protein Fadolivirus_1_1255 [Fadolivirus FV1/VV64]
MSFELLFSALSPLTDNGIEELDKYSEKEGYMMSTLSPSSENIILRDFAGQTQLNHDSEFTIFQLYMEDINVESITDFLPQENVYHDPINFQITDNSIVVNALSIGTLADTIKKSKNRYIFLPTNYTCETHNSGHRAVVVIDRNSKQVYLMEPNGRPSYFNSILGAQLENYIEFFLDYYIQQLNNAFSMNLNYINSNVWNSTRIVLNNSSNTQISKGDCLTISLLICQLVNNLEMEPGYVYEMIKSMSDNEFVSIIRSYSIGIIKYLKNSKNKRDLIYTEKLYNMYSDMKDANNFKSVYEINTFLHDTKKKNPELYHDLTKIYNLVTI